MKRLKIVIGALALALVCAGCGEPAVIEETTEVASVESVEESTVESTEESVEVSSEESTEESVEESVEEEAKAFEITKIIPSSYITNFKGECGTIEAITYMAKDYVGDGEEVEKKAYVYLPAGYDETKQYNVLYLMHGIGGSEEEWGLGTKNSKLQKILDNTFGNGDVEPFIVVTPNGKAMACQHETSNDFFYLYGYELRNDLIPYIESHYATYAAYSEEGYDMTATRTHRAMAGLSMGGMQTINIGIGECMDLFSWFGAFSAAPTSNTAIKTAETINNSEYTIDYFYNICGTEDNIAYGSASQAAKTITVFTDLLVDGENFTWQEKSGGHDFNIWHLGLYNFAHLAFQEADAE